jgi:hypothetical protein
LANLTNPSYANYTMFGDFFVKIFKFLRILYSVYKILVISKVKSFYPIEFWRIIFRIMKMFLGKTLEHYPMSEIKPLKSSMVRGCGHIKNTYA